MEREPFDDDMASEKGLGEAIVRGVLPASRAFPAWSCSGLRLAQSPIIYEQQIGRAYLSGLWKSGADLSERLKQA